MIALLIDYLLKHKYIHVLSEIQKDLTKNFLILSSLLIKPIINIFVDIWLIKSNFVTY